MQSSFVKSGAVNTETAKKALEQLKNMDLSSLKGLIREAKFVRPSKPSVNPSAKTPVIIPEENYSGVMDRLKQRFSELGTRSKNYWKGSSTGKKALIVGTPIAATGGLYFLTRPKPEEGTLTQEEVEALKQMETNQE